MTHCTEFCHFLIKPFRRTLKMFTDGSNLISCLDRLYGVSAAVNKNQEIVALILQQANVLQFLWMQTKNKTAESFQHKHGQRINLFYAQKHNLNGTNVCFWSNESEPAFSLPIFWSGVNLFILAGYSSAGAKLRPLSRTAPQEHFHLCQGNEAEKSVHPLAHVHMARFPPLK